METLRRKNDGWTTYQTRKVAGISIRRVNQVWSYYLQEGEPPVIGKRMGRPRVEITNQEVRIVQEAYARYRVCAPTLEKLIERDFSTHIPHNKIHKIMLQYGMAIGKRTKDKRKKDWIRYERRHSLTAVHIDWYYDSYTEKSVFAVIDDASRKLLALIECDSATVEASIEGMKTALKHGKIKQCISDHGSQFVSNNGGESQFQVFLDENGIKPILCRIKHPQSNGKVEKFFSLYKCKRHLFRNKTDFMFWYNEVRPHMSLNFEELETPQMAFVRKFRQEVI